MIGQFALAFIALCGNETVKRLRRRRHVANNVVGPIVVSCALQELLAADDFFSMDAMRQRSPYLHYQYIGKYQVLDRALHVALHEALHVALHVAMHVALHVALYVALHIVFRLWRLWCRTPLSATPTWSVVARCR